MVPFSPSAFSRWPLSLKPLFSNQPPWGQTMSELLADLEQYESSKLSASNRTLVRNTTDNNEPSDHSNAFDSQHSLSVSKEASKSIVPVRKPRKVKAGGKKPPGKKAKLLIAAGTAGYLFVVLGLIVIFRNQKGEEVGRMDLPDGTSVEVQATRTATPVTPAKPITNIINSAVQQWMKANAAVHAEKQVQAVAKRLQELNSGFDGHVIGLHSLDPPKIENGVVTEFGFNADDVTDISPVRTLTGLRLLSCFGSNLGNGRLFDLSPLKGMQLRSFYCNNTRVLDLSPLRGMPLVVLNCYGTDVSDLSPLEGCKSLRALCIQSTKVTPASVAALKKALPKCKIDWDDPARSKTPKPADSGTK